MSQKVNREEFLRVLENVQPGLSPRGIIQQSNCFGFLKGEVITFNEDIACRSKTKLGPEIKGAVQAAKLIEMLRKYPDEEIEVGIKNGRFVVRGKGKMTKLAMEAEVLMPMDSVEKPGQFRPLPADFIEAVNIVQECASDDKTKFTWTCVHVTPEYMEACDDKQLARYTFKTGFKKRTLIKRDSLKHAPALGMSEVSETDGWVHFRNSTGLVMSVQKNEGDYDDLSAHFKVDGSKIVLPKALAEAVDRANVLSSDNADKNLILVETHRGEVRIKGEGALGEHIEVKKVKYGGPDISFMVSPKLLTDLVTKHTDAILSPNRRLKVQGKKWIYMACMLTPRTPEPKEKE